jgi:hypothetical protein
VSVDPFTNLAGIESTDNANGFFFATQLLSGGKPALRLMVGVLWLLGLFGFH